MRLLGFISCNSFLAWSCAVFLPVLTWKKTEITHFSLFTWYMHEGEVGDGILLISKCNPAFQYVEAKSWHFVQSSGKVMERYGTHRSCVAVSRSTHRKITSNIQFSCYCNCRNKRVVISGCSVRLLNVSVSTAMKRIRENFCTGLHSSAPLPFLKILKWLRFMLCNFINPFWPHTKRTPCGVLDGANQRLMTKRHSTGPLGILHPH